MLENLMGKFRTIVFIVLGLAAGVLATVLYLHSQELTNNDCIKMFSLTSASLDCDTYDDTTARLGKVEKDINQAVALYLKEHKATRISVWTRDLITNQWAATNEFERYAPASLLKLPLMVAYYKLAEIEPTLLDTNLTYVRSELLNSNSQSFAPGKPLVEGQNYKVSALIEHMIIESDNNAAAVLLNHIDQTIFNNTMVDLGIKIPGSMNTYDFATAKSYASIFRTLYNASYLTRAYSEKALELMASSSFKGIAEPLPPQTMVAHKFGEREVDNPDGTAQTRELHDCGIVYKDSQPYSLCIMTEGTDFKDLLSVIQNISKIVYDGR